MAPRHRRRAARLVAASVAGAGAVFCHRHHLAAGFVGVPLDASGAAAAGAAAAAAAAESELVARSPLGVDGLPSLLLAATKGDLTQESIISSIDEVGIDPDFFYVPLGLVVTIGVGSWLITKQFWEKRWVDEDVNKKKLKLITREKESTPMDKFELGRLYNRLPDYSSALAEFDEVEEDFEDMRRVFDPEDAMGALASRAMLHNSKGYALQRLEPPKTSQARREFVRSVTFWPEFPEGLYNIGKELMERKRYDVAVRTFGTALKWQPGKEEFQKAQREAMRLATPDDEEE